MMERDDAGDPGGRRTLSVDDQQDLPVDLGLVERSAARALDVLGIPVDAEVTITLVTPQVIAELKERAFGARERTDVLAFPIDDLADPAPGPLVLGDVVVCPEVAREQARAAGRTADAEIVELVMHGILHLAGRDHADPASERAMLQEQRRLVLAARGGR